MKSAIRTLAILSLLILASCSSVNKVSYLQDSQITETTYIPTSSEITVRPLDKIEIVVNSKDGEAAQMLTLRRPSGSGNNSVEAYTVDKAGNIDFPLLGTVYVEGLTRQQIQEKIKNELISRDYLKDPIVSASFEQMRFVVNGEVNKPGVYPINTDRLNVLEALTTAGDLTILGKRENVKVIREEADGQLKTYEIDLRSKDLFNSPAYYIHQNDVIYVEPNNVRKGQSTMNDNSWKSVSLWVSMASVLASVAVLIFR